MDVRYQLGIRKDLLGAQSTKIAKLGIGWVSVYRQQKQALLFKRLESSSSIDLWCWRAGNLRLATEGSSALPQRQTPIGLQRFELCARQTRRKFEIPVLRGEASLGRKNPIDLKCWRARSLSSATEGSSIPPQSQTPIGLQRFELCARQTRRKLKSPSTERGGLI